MAWPQLAKKLKSMKQKNYFLTSNMPVTKIQHNKDRPIYLVVFYVVQVN